MKPSYCTGRWATKWLKISKYLRKSALCASCQVALTHPPVLQRLSTEYAWLLFSTFFKLIFFHICYQWSRVSFCSAEWKSSPWLCQFLSGSVRCFSINISELPAWGWAVTPRLGQTSPGIPFVHPFAIPFGAQRDLWCWEFTCKSYFSKNRPLSPKLCNWGS